MGEGINQRLHVAERAGAHDDLAELVDSGRVERRVTEASTQDSGLGR